MDKLNSSAVGSEHPAAPGPDRAGGAISWLIQQSVWIVLFGALFYLILSRIGIEGLVSIAKAALGLTVVIFIHELGHFMVAKWCDVHVETFSIGFGPAIPGCSFRKGETLYKLALFPLGGYVKMVGEGTESDDGEDDPRSFKNKSVGQRMAIISAGVIMNVILAAIFFFFVYNHGVTRPAAVVGQVDGGGRAWQKGLPSGAVFQQIGDKSDPGQLYFEDLQRAVYRSRAGQKIKFVYTLPPGSDKHELEIEPRSEKDDEVPRVGLTSARSTVLPLKTEMPKSYTAPVDPGSPADAAREPVNLEPGDSIVAATESDKNSEVTPLPAVKPGDLASLLEHDFALAKRCQALAGKKMLLRIERKGGKTDEIENQPTKFAWGDMVVGATDPDQSEVVKPLASDRHNTGSGQTDFFDLQNRLQRLEGRFVTIRVKGVDGQERNLWVPPAYHSTLGVSFRIGRVSALREGSPAQKAGLKKDDILQQVSLTDDKNESITFLLSRKNNDPAVAPGSLVDPVRLPSKMQEWADKRHGVKAKLTVLRDQPQKHLEQAPLTLPEVAWDSSDLWRYDLVIPLYPSSGEVISGLGIAYKVEAIVEEGATPELRRDDVIKAVQLISRQVDPKTGEPIKGSWTDIKQDQWSYVFEKLQEHDLKGLGFKVERKVGNANNLELVDVAVDRNPDSSWPMADLGMRFKAASRVRQAKDLSSALVMGLRDTQDQILDVFERLRALVTGRISVKTMGGILTISVVAYQYAGMDIWEFLFFLAMISINLAVLNFLPIPLLDGGHMVFLLYEKIRGRPASEGVRLVATYIGVAMILGLMLFVFYQDIMRIFF